MISLQLLGGACVLILMLGSAAILFGESLQFCCLTVCRLCIECLCFDSLTGMLIWVLWCFDFITGLAKAGVHRENDFFFFVNDLLCILFLCSGFCL